MKIFRQVLLASAALGVAVSGASAATLDDVRDNGFLQCGINTGLAGFAFTDDNNEWQGFDVAFCRAVTAAVFGDPQAVRFTNLTGTTRFTALASGEIDLLSRNTTWTVTRDVDLGFTFLGISYYDGQGFITRSEFGLDSVTGLDGATICIQTGTTTELNLAEYFRINNISYQPVPVETNAEARTNYVAESCDAYTTDASGLAATRATFDDPGAHVVLPEIISKEPLGPLVREGDDQWADLTRWVLNALIIAEEKGITSANVEQIAADGSDDPEVNRLLGLEGDFGTILGVENDWAVQAIKAVGNYGEIFDEFLGPDTPIGLQRGLNALWTDGGLLYAPPFR